ncbi:macro domain-containing protein [Adhaeribacter aerolatus]|uniref:Macro domain-containing protein n=1 Tax=Adhaeribacter aerolatus TaxID=670289 RepID=A0A512ARQ0_9BACT|nr:O-acetyl-ADP-ribose deacetylase [Adhaeribacter aerolatus]GEO02390.1 macro domain-containing protein [Adhaeribacter aerolatus]
MDSWKKKIQQGNRLVLFQGDITKVAADAIVNAANSSLLGGGGVDGAIHRAGGPAILEACKEIRARQGSCPTGEAVVTPAGNLPAKYVIHTVGPVWQSGDRDEPELLANCYRNSLKLAVAHGAKTVAFPNISTGVYSYPKDKAAEVAIRTVSTFLAQDSFLDYIIFVVFDKENYNIYQQLINKDKR